MKKLIILSVLVHVIKTQSDPCNYATDNGQYTAKCTNFNLEQIPDDVIDSQTRSIDLSDNNFQNNLKSIAGNLINVRQIKLISCQIRTIYRTTFASLWQLDTLDLRRNGLTTIEMGSFDNNTKLLKLDLGENHLESVQGLFNNNLPIVVLKLNNNHIKHVSKDSFLLPKLDELHLEYNDLTVIDLGTQLTFPKKMFIYLNNNNWNCSCDLIPFRNFITKNLINRDAIEKKMICAAPSTFKGTDLQQIPIEKLECPKEVAANNNTGFAAPPDWSPGIGTNSDEPAMAGIPQNTFWIIVSLTVVLFLLLLSAIIYICCKKGLCCWQKESATQPKTFEDVALMAPSSLKTSRISMVGNSQVDGIGLDANQVAKPPRSLVSNESGMTVPYNDYIMPNRRMTAVRNVGSMENVSPQDYAYRVLNYPQSGYASGRVSPASSLVSEPPSFAPFYGGMRRRMYAPQHPLNYTTMPRNQPSPRIHYYHRQPVQFPVDKMQMLKDQILRQRRMSLTSEPGFSMAYYDGGMPVSDNQGLRTNKFGGSQTSLNSNRGWMTPNTPATPLTPLTPASIRSQWNTIHEHDEHY